MSSSTFPGILTASGREVTTHEGVPSLSDIALSLSRQPRFGGHTRSWWTVLDHSLFVEELAEREAELLAMDDIQARALRLAALLHDAHESLTADVPSPFKPAMLKVRQAYMDKRIFAAYYPGGYDAYLAFETIVKDLDRRALVTEAFFVGPAALDSIDAVTQYFGACPTLNDRIAFVDADLSVDPAELAQGLECSSVSIFTGLYLTLR